VDHEGEGLESLQKFTSAQANVYNYFNRERSLCSRSNFKPNRAAAVDE